MSGLDLLLKTSIDYERTHQMVLYTLLGKTSFPKHAFGISKIRDILWEPKKQLFDLAILSDPDDLYLEIKMWSVLSDDQISRQNTFLSKEQKKGVYVLFGTSWFEHTSALLEEKSNGRCTRIGYEELIDGLNKLIIEPRQSSDVVELARAYRDSIQEQFDFLLNGLRQAKKDKIFYYSLYWSIQKKLGSLDTAIYTVNNPGGQVYILNNRKWYPVTINQTSVDLYYELVNDRLCIKFFAKAEDNDVRQKIRDVVRNKTHKVLDQKYHIIDSGRIGAYMTACQIDYDFSNINKIDESASLYKDIHDAMNEIAQGI